VEISGTKSQLLHEEAKLEGIQFQLHQTETCAAPRRVLELGRKRC